MTNSSSYSYYHHDKKKKIWNKTQYKTKSNSPYSFLHLFFFCFWIILLLLQLPTYVKTVSGEEEDKHWDGVVVTKSNFLALQAFKQELVDPGGFLKSWNDSGYGACSGGWIGIECAKGQVIVIQLPWKGLKGQITERIGQLQQLRKLILHDNQIDGSIPLTLGLVRNLRGVQLFNNRLQGSIPPSLGYCPLLQSLDLSNNLLTGTIPDSLANSNKLYLLNLSFNSFSGPIPTSLTHLASLTFLYLQHNNLSSSVPNTWGGGGGGGVKNGLFRLQSLILDHNLLSGRIPASLGRLSELKEISLSHNQFSGHIPASVGNISNLMALDLSMNNLSGEIPLSFDTLYSLNLFNVSYNNLSNPVPTVLARKFNSSSFAGNIELCGYSISTQCPSPAPVSGVLAAPPESSQQDHHRVVRTVGKLLLEGGALTIVYLTISCILLFCLIRKGIAAKAWADKQDKENDEKGGKFILFDFPIAFASNELLRATAEIMGKSPYGYVFKATLEDGSQVAVKRLRYNITKSFREFELEVSALWKIRHPNLLALRACLVDTSATGEKLLVFDYMKGNLASLLHVRESETTIDWPTRMTIAQGIARGLCYLHSQENIAHGNLMSSNVLLDDDKNAKIAYFGVYRLMTNTGNSNAIASAGILGCPAPELSKHKKVNYKTDIYSLGVILLELLTGKSSNQPVNEVDLPKWVAAVVKKEWTNEVFDVELMRDASTFGHELLKTLKLALHCVDPSPSARPRIQQVLQQLEEIRPGERSVPSSCFPTLNQDCCCSVFV